MARALAAMQAARKTTAEIWEEEEECSGARCCWIALELARGLLKMMRVCRESACRGAVLAVY